MKTISEYQLKKVSSDLPKVKVNNSQIAADYIRQFYFDDISIYESCFVLLLNRANDTIGYAKISQGGVTGTIIDTKLVFKYAVDSLASSLVICHNHPSGQLTPSQDDINITKRIKEACKLFDMCLLDHIILTEESYYSFADNGDL